MDDDLEDEFFLGRPPNPRYRANALMIVIVVCP